MPMKVGDEVKVKGYVVPGMKLDAEYRHIERHYINGFAGNAGKVCLVDDTAQFPVMVYFGEKAKIRYQRFSPAELEA